MGNRRGREWGRPSRVVRLAISKRKPLKKAIAEALARWMKTLEEDVRETFDYSAIELRVVWSFDNEARDHFRELIVTTEGRRSR